ncbi:MULTISPECIES: hypothetical protein [unclassified Rathayibacter]|jgi:hypothetical protein|uniref:hypothetical protein n=1 Tax=unclassified Rathayibacter TaxID=2609250 RepID=UPI000CE89D83|nr:MULTISPECIES: hypothetical protein [unclassified Rathayibacter]PPF12794.1 hypothetical protein C5B98_02680 [Rathayibacter sp. AY1A5]PPF30172.1 hypothetical protein C5C54_00820 [Rathayibacter sp. AY1F2]PPG55150.1 hypothetical protein C5C41_00715 [Rathayibacter sp. AY1E9]PPH10021.1 hypothetical protein C5C33_00335 [Rathayibacter sp. AY1H3]PPH10183.1 hypothetical protein C5C33_01310 [Rathayibacter sp. AY1H3]
MLRATRDTAGIQLDSTTGSPVRPDTPVSVVASAPQSLISRMLGRRRCEACGAASARRRDGFCSADCAGTFHLYE